MNSNTDGNLAAINNHLEELDLVDIWDEMSEEEQDQYIADNTDEPEQHHEPEHWEGFQVQDKD
jgi:hypothetical protein